MPRRDLFHLLCSHLLHAQDRIYCCLREGDCLACFPFPLFWQIIPEEYYHLITPLVSSLEVQVQDASRVFFWSGLFSAYRQALFQPRPHLAFYSPNMPSAPATLDYSCPAWHCPTEIERKSHM